MDAAQAVGPVILFLLMTLVGLELTLDDFRRVLATPRAVIAGTLGQILLLPLMTWAVVAGLGVAPVFGAGAILVAVAPGAGMSNILAAFGRANVALSVTLTAVSSTLAVVTLPIVSRIGMEVFLGEASDVEVPVASLVGQLLGVLLVPISLGMTLRSRHPERARRLAPRLQRATLVAIVVLVGLAVAFTDDEQVSLEGGGLALVAAGVWTLAAMAIGWGLASLMRLDDADRFTFLIEFCARNIAVSGIVAMSGLGRLDLTLFSGVYGAVGYPLAIAAVVIRRRLTL